jgi:hypothetical protein
MNTNETTRPKRRFQFSLKALVISVAVIGLLLCPFSTKIAPPVKVHVVNEKGEALSGVSVCQVWINRNIDSKFREDKRNSGADGYVEFPERSTTACIVARVFGLLWNIVNFGPHASFGGSASVGIGGMGTGYKAQHVWSLTDGQCYELIARPDKSAVAPKDFGLK